MQNINRYSILAIIGGGLLAMMIHINSQLALETSAINASWLAHGLGGLLALGLYNVVIKAVSLPTPIKSDVPKLFYLGGLPGAFTVILASVTVNSAIGLSGTLALGLIGQLICSIFCEALGLFGLRKRKLTLLELLPISLVVFGSILIISQRY
ncbi:DMT family transporter [Moritella sp. 5]|uniref:DMT family transporter n=1 Tax=Moritella sp. 5 TaxID=2746231 RepID=UPI001BA71B28|nr:DMT family transporter [Moritella sp. 5]QUM81629.1 DMT family transporter [Moritella sp. 5]